MKIRYLKYTHVIFFVLTIILLVLLYVHFLQNVEGFFIAKAGGDSRSTEQRMRDMCKPFSDNPNAKDNETLTYNTITNINTEDAAHWVLDRKDSITLNKYMTDISNFPSYCISDVVRSNIVTSYKNGVKKVYEQRCNPKNDYVSYDPSPICNQIRIRQR